MLPHLQILLWAGQPNRSPLQIFDSDALHSLMHRLMQRLMRHHGPRWEQKNAAHCCQQTARHTTSSYRASWINAQIAAPLGSYDAANLTVLLFMAHVIENDAASHSAVLMPLHILLSSSTVSRIPRQLKLFVS